MIEGHKYVRKLAYQSNWEKSGDAQIVDANEHIIKWCSEQKDLENASKNMYFSYCQEQNALFFFFNAKL